MTETQHAEDLKTVNELLVPATGPTPFHMPSLAGCTWQGMELRWNDQNPALLRAGDTVLGVADNGVYIYPDPSTQALFAVCSNATEGNTLTLRQYGLSSLTPLPEDQIRDYGYAQEFHTTLASVPTFTFSASLTSETQALTFPAPFSGMAPFLFFVSEATTKDFFLLDVHPSAGTVTALPQNWFNHRESRDDLYEWPLYAVRNPANRKIYGEAMRMGVFILAENGTELERWAVSYRS